MSVVTQDRIDADARYQVLHAELTTDMMTPSPCGLAFAHAWSLVLYNLPEARSLGIYANIDYQRELGRDVDPRFRAVSYLLNHRAKLFLQMLQETSSTSPLYVDIDMLYHFTLGWSKRFRDKINTEPNEKVEHLWLN